MQGPKIYQRLGRTTSSGRFIPEIDGLRFLAITAVFLFHLRGFMSDQWVGWNAQAQQSPVVRLLAFANYGVELFFVISGFILALPFFKQHRGGGERVNLRRYYLRRIKRLEAPYLLSLAICAAVAHYVRHWPVAETAKRAGAGAFYLHSQIFGEMNPLSPVTWSLEVEVQFYLLAPFLAWLFAISQPALRRGLIMALALLFVLLQIAFLQPNTRLGLSLLNYLPYFLAGFLLADLYMASARKGASLKWDAVSLMGWPLVIWACASWTPLLYALPFAFMLLCHAALRGVYSQKFLRLRPLTTIGGMCYSIYLLHLLLMYIVGRLSKQIVVGESFALNMAIQLVVISAPALLVCGLFFVFVEKPCMNGQAAVARRPLHNVALP